MISEAEWLSAKPVALREALRRLRRAWLACAPPRAKRRSEPRRAPTLAFVPPAQPPTTLEALERELLEPVPGGDADAVAPELRRFLSWLAAEAFREMFRP